MQNIDVLIVFKTVDTLLRFIAPPQYYSFIYDINQIFYLNKWRMTFIHTDIHIDNVDNKFASYNSSFNN